MSKTITTHPWENADSTVLYVIVFKEKLMMILFELKKETPVFTHLRPVYPAAETHQKIAISVNDLVEIAHSGD